MKPQVKKYLNAFQFLQDCYHFRKESNPNFSYEVWARELKIGDKSNVRSMIMGNRLLHPEMMRVFANNLKLDESESEYFKFLVQYNQSHTEEQKSLFRKKLVELLQDQFQQFEMSAQYEFLSNPLMPKLHVLLSLSDINCDAENLAHILRSTKEEIEKSLQQLLKMDLIKKTSTGFATAGRNFKVPDGYNDLGLEAFYMQSMEDLKKAISLPSEDRRFKTLFVAMNKKEFEKFLSNMQAYAKEQLAAFDVDCLADRKLYQVHLNVMAISEVQKAQVVDQSSIDL